MSNHFIYTHILYTYCGVTQILVLRSLFRGDVVYARIKEKKC